MSPSVRRALTKLQKISMILAVSVLTITLVFMYTSVSDSHRIIDGLRVAKLSIDTSAVQKIGNVITSGNSENLFFDPDYMKLVNQLNDITDAFPVATRWSYIVQQGSDETKSVLAVLTIPHQEDVANTYPGYIYDIKDYPAMQKSLYYGQDVVVSNIVFDNTYNFLTRTGLIRLYHNGAFVGTLAVDLKSEYIISMVINTLLLGIMYSSLIVLIVIRYYKRFMLTDSQLRKLQECEKCS